MAGKESNRERQESELLVLQVDIVDCFVFCFSVL